MSRSLDDLDRLAFRLSRTVRTQYPHLLTQGFTLTDLEERLLPFREARREMADGGADAFERAVLRLIAGERGYLQTESELQAACTQALASPSPSMSLVRAWATTSLRLTPPANTVGTERLTTPTATVGSDRTAEAKPDIKPCGCRFCGNRLPENRRMTFCPHCGMDMTKRQCPACSTELDVNWRFCVTCGRSADLPEIATPIRRAG
ncbi:zinc ribbon domain-containing protein [Gemmatimonas sp.]|uniref:zinc ribbon domain-containing protein n=1 Tax=Gemmatimonas sp. TaxID=1962908 RepID=UPI003983BD47